MHAADTDGNAIEQDIERAYPLAPAGRPGGEDRADTAARVALDGCRSRA